MAKLRHLAILTHQPDKLADFYKRVFDMKEMYRTKNGSVHLSDGEVNLAILNATDPKEPGHQPGLYHFGFHVEDNQEIARRIQKIYPDGAPKEREAARTRTATFSISPPSAGVTSEEWISSNTGLQPRFRGWNRQRREAQPFRSEVDGFLPLSRHRSAVLRGEAKPHSNEVESAK